LIFPHSYYYIVTTDEEHLENKIWEV
jgi:hypothetical protein